MQKTLNYLYGLERLGIKLGLEVIIKLLQALGNPQQQFKSVHIAGTNGKGSVAAYTASILRAAGYKTGLYTSPHLIRFNERIQINGQEISYSELVELVQEIKAVAEQEQIQPTFFEFTTALAFLYLARKKVDWAVIETGMGGRLDATNTLKPEIAIITAISFDHQRYLGDTLPKIATEKAGIIKEKIPVVVAENNPEVRAVFERVSQEKNCPLFSVQDEMKVIERKEHDRSQEFKATGAVNGKFEIKLLGEHQIDNALTAIVAAKKLGVKEEDIREGIRTAAWPGRLQFLSENILVDCAHNVAGMERLRQFVLKLPQRKVLLLALANDKEIAKMVSLIAPLFQTVIITKGNYKPAETSIIATEVKKDVTDVQEIPNLAAALETARNSISETELLLITGSMYMLGDALKILKENNL